MELVSGWTKMKWKQTEMKTRFLLFSIGTKKKTTVGPQTGRDTPDEIKKLSATRRIEGEKYFDILRRMLMGGNTRG